MKKPSINGKKVTIGCTTAILANSALMYCGIMPLWVYVLSTEVFLVAIFARHTAAKIERQNSDSRKSLV